jgi:hypothetical protein
MAHIVRVEPAQEGWLVRSGEAPPLRFDTSAQAVWSARKVGESIADAGLAAEIVISDREGRVAARFACQPAPELQLA